MPLVESSYKRPPFFYANKHLETIIPSLTRKIDGVLYTREQIETPDDDFLNVDWVKNGNNRLLVISHGLEGGSDRHYVKGLAKLFSQHGWDVAAWNNRTCNGEMNRQRILYHHAASYDLRTVVEHCITTESYKEVVLAGISMGGGQTLRYLGEESEFGLPKEVTKAVAISAPCSLIESAATLKNGFNKVYGQKFLNKLKSKIQKKAEQFPDIDVNGIEKIKDLTLFDELYSAPIHGFKSAEEFYEHCNPYPFLKQITRDVLIINALNDPMLVGECFPVSVAESNPHIHLEIPKRGGHVGFMLPNSEFTYSEKRTLEFLNA
ncbi:hypothetical protein BXY85_0038 [Roseivirga pacifica]|uniref:Serine aminopeptidase S33 domain-containing protein n=1 Tax=Roseivirga pacifica TaxID=1267423 RepID=A0A1I0R593_9BACT|nr:alpha/beta fold hydrolase [Roseivirga pacifica]RKQ49051.1 hypothetical protein BXY85_0038 [Roseivirga pacifica]SEW35702.1 hypothetical protein SAMN05216290_3091 [Roseivirga pacifica]